jgi:hypothetical protein
MADEDGQSPQTREWVKRRDAADAAIENVRRRTEEDDNDRRRDAEERVQESPILFFVGVICAGIVIVGGLWWFISAVECDPVISDRAYSAACR